MTKKKEPLPQTQVPAEEVVSKRQPASAFHLGLLAGDTTSCSEPRLKTVV